MIYPFASFNFEVVKKFYLDISYDHDFLLFGIASQEPSYRMAWLMNQQFAYTFSRGDDIVFIHPNNKESCFPKYDYTDEINRLNYFLISNKDEGQWLIPELKNIDYLLMVKGALTYFKKSDFTSSVKKIEHVQLITEVKADMLKSKHHLIIPQI